MNTGNDDWDHPIPAEAEKKAPELSEVRIAAKPSYLAGGPENSQERESGEWA